MSKTTEHQAHVKALIAVVEAGGWFYAPDKRLFDWAMDCPNLRMRVTNNREEAIARRAFLVERPYHPGARNKHQAGYRLNRFIPNREGGAGQSDVGQNFASAESFWEAMAMLNDFTRELGSR